MIQTEFPFTLPIGYQDADGTLHREGIMRMATAGDEILPLKDPRVQGNEAYLSVILMARVITRLGRLEAINTKVIEGLYAKDFAYLQELYNRANGSGGFGIKVTCPKCAHEFEAQIQQPGEL